MSIKRTKQRSFHRDDDDAHPGFNRTAPEPEKPWEEQIAGQPDDAFVPYALTRHFGKGALIQHAKFGRGVVTAVEDKRVEVLFADGKKKLGHSG